MQEVGQAAELRAEFLLNGLDPIPSFEISGITPGSQSCGGFSVVFPMRLCLLLQCYMSELLQMVHCYHANPAVTAAQRLAVQ